MRLTFDAPLFNWQFTAEWADRTFDFVFAFAKTAVRCFCFFWERGLAAGVDAASPADPVVRRVRGHTPDRHLARDDEHCLVDVGGARRDAVVAAGAHRARQQHGRLFQDDEAELRRNPRWRHHVIHRIRRPVELAEFGCGANLIRYIGGREADNRFIRATFRHEHLIGAARCGIGIPDEPGRKLDARVLEIPFGDAAHFGALPLVQDEGRRQRVRVRASLHVGRAILVAGGYRKPLDPEFGQRGRGGERE